MSVSRSVGAAFGAVVIGAVLFGVAGRAHNEIAALLAGAGELASRAAHPLLPSDRAAVAGDVDRAFHAVFGTLALIAAAGATLAASIPRKRL